jgi:integrase
MLLGWPLGQRPSDLRKLTWKAYGNGCFAVRQRKTGKFIVVPVLPELSAEPAKATRASTQIVVSEETGRPYLESAFEDEFARIRALAGLLRERQFRDLMHTFATALTAGCTVHETQATTGHKTI